MSGSWTAPGAQIGSKRHGWPRPRGRKKRRRRTTPSRGGGRGEGGAERVSPVHGLINKATKSLNRAARITHEFELYPYEIDGKIRGGTYTEFEYGQAVPNSTATESPQHSPGDADAPHLFLEQHRWEDLDGDGCREPWIVTVHKDSGKVVRVYANFDVEDIRVRQRGGKIVRVDRRDYFVHYPFLPDPNGGFYGIGLGLLLCAHK